ncbi:MAG: hypothetical protein LBB28_05600 [Synergistaceae bacterium]|jgi:uncharacterized tellurite resistance protein B-like protein|nr:hypothetical protein [Synergistaceae bacterium]
MSSDRTVKPRALLSIAQLGNLLGIRAEGESLAVPSKLGLYEAAKGAGYLIVPHILPEYVDVSGDDVVTIVKMNPREELSQFYPLAHLMVELGMSVAMGNGMFEPSEIRQLSYIMERNFDFTDMDVRALAALKDFSSLYPPDIETIAERLLQTMPPDKCRQLARVMTTVGAAGSIGSGKIIALRKLFAILDLDERRLYQLLMSFRYSDSGIIEVESLFEPQRKSPEGAVGYMLDIDLEVVAHKKKETESLGMILSEIFAKGA